MPLTLEVTLILVLLAVAAGLIPLLLQLRRSAQGLDAFLASARGDLNRIAEDVHASRLQIDRLATSLQAHLDDISGIMGVMRGVKNGVLVCSAMARKALDPVANPLAGVLAGVAAAWTLFRRRPSRAGSPR